MLWIALIILAVISLALRTAPLLIPESLEKHWTVQTIGRLLPAALMVLILIHLMQETPFKAYPYGIPQLVGLAGTMGIHYWRKNLFISIATGMAVFVAASRLALYW